jgi:hypothetical protein
VSCSSGDSKRAAAIKISANHCRFLRFGVCNRGSVAADACTAVVAARAPRSRTCVLSARRGAARVQGRRRGACGGCVSWLLVRGFLPPCPSLHTHVALCPHVTTTHMSMSLVTRRCELRRRFVWPARLLLGVSHRAVVTTSNHDTCAPPRVVALGRCSRREYPTVCW